MIKVIFVYVILFFFILNNAFSQWDSLHCGMTLTYQFERKKKSSDYIGNEKILSIKKSFLKIKVDTIIEFGNNERKLIFLSKCLNSELLNEKYEIVNENIRTPESSIGLMGVPIIDGVSSNSGNQISIVYQIKDAIYLITAPRKDFQNNFHSFSFFEKFKNVLLELEKKSFFLYYDLDSYILFTGLKLPLRKFILLKSSIDEQKSRIHNDEYLLGFLTFSKAKMRSDSKMGGGYLNFYQEANNLIILKEVSLSSTFGIVSSRSLAVSRKDKYTYVNTLKLIATSM